MSTTQYPDAAFTQDEYGVVENSEDTYRAIANVLRDRGAVSLGWTDNAMSHMDVLLVLTPIQVGPSNRMDSVPGKLFIAVAGYGMFGFALARHDDIHPGYLAEKVSMRYSPTTVALAELFNGVMGQLTAVTA